VAFLLRFVQACLRWDEIALAYAAYQQPFVDAVWAGDLGAWANFHGLHPPLYSLFFLLLDALWGAPGAWLLFSAIVSTAAVWVVGRSAGLAAAAILAVDPLQIAYAGEVNNYPLLVLLVTLVLWSGERAKSGGSTTALLICGILASWTHFLGGLVFGLFGLQLLRQDRRRGLRVMGIGLLGALPVLIRMLQLAGESGSYGQSGLDVTLIGTGLVEKIGWWWLLVLPAAVGAVRHKRALGWTAFALVVAILSLFALQIAAPHQQPYWLVLGPFVAILVAANPGPLPWLLAVLGLLTVGSSQLNRVGALREDLHRERAIDEALRLAEPMDAFWLVAPALQPDDDKQATSDVLWRLSPWTPAPAFRQDFEFVDPRFGQPRVWGERVVHTSVDIVEGEILSGCQRRYISSESFESAVGWHLDAGKRLWVILYDHGPACDMPGGMDWALRNFNLGELSPDDPSSPCLWVGENHGLGRDRLCVVESRR
jgi:hypothetical protein